MLVLVVIPDAFGAILNGDAASQEAQAQPTGPLIDSLTTDQLVELAKSAPVPKKLEGSTETVDDNGVVRGTTPDGIEYTVHGRGVGAASGDKITLAAVGDQIATERALEIADANKGEVGDLEYDFNPWYKEVGPAIRQYDLRYINQETVFALGDTWGETPTHYPSFNSPVAVAEAISDQKFNLVNFATNHIYDFQDSGIELSHERWKQFPELIVAGSFTSEQDRETVQMIERNGTTFAFLAYTYGDNRFANGEEVPSNDYYDCFFDEELMTADIERAKKVADGVIVSMHWGEEYDENPTGEQRQWAQWLADIDVDLVIGTHAHTVQPVEYYTGRNGNITPVVFGLSDLICSWELADTLLSGMFTCDFVVDEQGHPRARELKWHPMVEWSDDEETYVRFLSSMDEDTINANTLPTDEQNQFALYRDKTQRVVSQIPVEWDAVEQDLSATRPVELVDNEPFIDPEFSIPDDYEVKTPVQSAGFNGMQVLWMGMEPGAPVEDLGDRRIVLYLHGGAYVNQFDTGHLTLLDQVCQNTDAAAIVPLYPIAPAHNYETSYALLGQLYSDLVQAYGADRIVIMGDSAGGGLAAGLCEHVLTEGLPRAHSCILISPWLDASLSNPDIAYYEETDKLLTVDSLLASARKWAVDGDLEDWHISPINGYVGALPPVTMFVSTSEIMYPDVLRFEEKLVAAGVPCNLQLGRDQCHDYPLITPKKTNALDVIYAAVLE